MNTDNGVSSRGGRVVSVMSGRFRGNRTRGRSPLPNGK
jgi:hypothetical protein